jgi:hypothetical protein
MTLRSRVAMVVLLGCAACGHTDVSAVVFRPAIVSASVTVPLYREGQATPPVATDLALVQVLAHGSEASVEQAASALAARGAVLGCEAIIRVRFAQGYTRTHAAGICVTFVH